MARPAEVFVRTLRGRERRWLRSLRRCGTEFASAVRVRRAQVVEMSGRRYRAPEIADAVERDGLDHAEVVLVGDVLRDVQAVRDELPEQVKRANMSIVPLSWHFWQNGAGLCFTPPQPVVGPRVTP